jgi:hypothetical protein
MVILTRNSRIGKENINNFHFFYMYLPLIKECAMR